MKGNLIFLIKTHYLLSNRLETNLTFDFFYEFLNDLISLIKKKNLSLASKGILDVLFSKHILVTRLH
jgi:hypothetical protein